MSRWDTLSTDANRGKTDLDANPRSVVRVEAGVERSICVYEQGSRTLSCAIVGVGVKGGGKSSQGPEDGLKKYGSLGIGLAAKVADRQSSD